MKTNFFNACLICQAFLLCGLQPLFAQPARPAITPPTPWVSGSIFSKVLNSPVTQTPGDSRSVNWIDYDNDQDLDLFISNGPQGGAPNFLYRNDGPAGFTAVTSQSIVTDSAPSDGATWADYDNDGDIDCFVVNWYGVNNQFYQNNGDGTFEKMTTGAFVNDGGFSETASWGDYDQDGFVDLYVSNSAGNKRNFLYRNNGAGSFTKIINGAAVTDAATSRSVNWIDYDLDGDADLFVTNENNEQENLYRNDAGVLTKITGGPLLTAGGKTMSSSWADYDNDGDFDVFLANDQGNDALFRNDNGTFVRITTGPVVTSGGNSFGSQWADIDLDGDQDLFVTNAFGSGLLKNFLFLNQGDGTFIRDTAEVVSQDEGWSYGCAFGDYDHDGDLDLAVANCYNAVQPDYLYQNHSNESGRHWLVVQCTGVGSNHSAIGAMVWAYSQLNGQPFTQLREISAQSGYCGQNQLAAHFGFGAVAAVDSVVVQWPSGIRQALHHPQVDQYVQLTEPETVGVRPELAVLVPELRILPNPFTDSVTVYWEMPASGNVLLEVIDWQGKTVVSSQLVRVSGAQQWTWDGETVEQAASGVYFVRIQGEGWSVTREVVRG